MGILTSPSDLVRATSDDWREDVRQAIRSVSELRRRLQLTADEDPRCHQVESAFGTFVPLPFLSRMTPGDPRDPLLLQVLPAVDELREVPGFTRDPLAEVTALDAGTLSATATRVDGSPGVGTTPVPLLAKYPGRRLMVVTGACAVHCRYCFRRHFPYEWSRPSRDVWQRALDEVAADVDCRELILSGGDPLTVVDEQLAFLFQRAASIPHLRRIRLHTRLPVVIPRRVTRELCRLLEETQLPVCVVWHVNHPRELDASVAAAASRMRAVPRVTLLNQSVLLRGVNNAVDVLASLSESLWAAGIQPYYLHQLDRVQGAAGFEVPIEEGRQLIRAMRAQLPGYLVPRYVQEVPGLPHKSWLE